MAKPTAEDPVHVRAAPSHANPYPYYARLARERPLFRDDVNGCWVAASASAVRAVLNSDACHTRPATRVPEALRGGAAGDLYGRLVRLRDDRAHAALKHAVVAAVTGLELARVAALSRAEASTLDGALGEPIDRSWVTRFMFGLPQRVLASLLGARRERVPDIALWLGDYGTAAAAAVTGVPALTDDIVARGHRGARGLIELVGDLAADPPAAGPLLRTLIEHARKADCNEEDIIANGAGLLVQGCGAIASLIGGALLALCRDPDLRGRIEGNRTLLRPFVQEVIRCDPPTNSTLRFVTRDTKIAGQAMRAGDTIIVLIAAANRDPSLNAEPDRFDPDRSDRRYLEFGMGVHACPADKLSPLIAETAIDYLLTRGAPIADLEESLSYAASAHIRTALFSN